MIDCDEAALICDLAETYGIYDYKSLPLSTVAVLSCGLRDNSRIKMKMSGAKADINTMMLASCLDQLLFLAWSKTENAQHGIGRPKSVLNSFINKENENMAFDSVEEFNKAWEELNGN